MTASDYKISFPYGATSAPYSPSHPHRGDDRACPTGTPVVINGVTIGLTGATGFVDGPHLHVQEWHNNYLDIRKPQNAFKGGIVTNIDPNGTQGDGSFGKFITVKTADGWSDSYCHLSEIKVKIGQELKAVQGGNDMYPNQGDLTNFYNSTGWPGHPPNGNDIAYWCYGTGNANWSKGADDVWKDLMYTVTQYVLAHPKPAPAGTKLNKGNYYVE